MIGPTRFRWQRLIVAGVAALVISVGWIAAADAHLGATKPHSPTIAVSRAAAALPAPAPAAAAVFATPTSVAEHRAAAAAAASTTAAGSSGLPFTGGDVVAVSLICIGLLTIGVSLSSGRRRGYPYSNFLDS